MQYISIRALSRVSALFATALLVPSIGFAQTSPFYYTFNTAGILQEASTPENSSSPYFWVNAGGKLVIENGVGSTIRGVLPVLDPWRTLYAQRLPVQTDNGTHPQNVFRMFTKQGFGNVSAEIYFNRKAINLSNAANKFPYTGEAILARYKNDDTFYYGGLRADGKVVIKKQNAGVYQTLASKTVFPGTYSSTNPNLIPLSRWIGLKLVVQDTSSGPKLTLYTDIGKSGAWRQELSVVDESTKYGAPITGSGTIGIATEFADTQFENLSISEVGSTATAPAQQSSPPPPPPAPSPTPTGYDQTVLGDNPVMFLAMNSGSTGTETDKSGKGRTGTYKGGTPGSGTMPNGDKAAVFNGSSQYVTVPSHSSLSIPTTKQLTWEAWVRPDTLQFPNSHGGFVDILGKCANYSPTCEWEGRMYDLTNPENRPNRISAYAFNSTAGLGSGADWQQASSIIQAGKWLHIVAQYQLNTTPSHCNPAYPGTIEIWVNGVKWSAADHKPTGCMSQFSITPKANTSPVNIGTMGFDTWFKGAIGKVAVYNYLLTQAQISEHYKAMTGLNPSGSCADKCTSIMP